MHVLPSAFSKDASVCNEQHLMQRHMDAQSDENK